MQKISQEHFNRMIEARYGITNGYAKLHSVIQDAELYHDSESNQVVAELGKAIDKVIIHFGLQSN